MLFIFVFLIKHSLQTEIWSNSSLSITLQPLDEPYSNVDHFNGNYQHFIYHVLTAFL